MVIILEHQEFTVHHKHSSLEELSFLHYRLQHQSGPQPARVKNNHTTGQIKSTHNNKLYYKKQNLFMGINILNTNLLTHLALA